MSSNRSKDVEYRGFEQGPIRPPSEAGSLLIRITRNCPWNRCTFCPVYKGSGFSLRPIEHVLEDINSVHNYVQEIRQSAGVDGNISHLRRNTLAEGGDRSARNAAVQWAANGMWSIFLQDANSLIIKPQNLITVLARLKSCFPWVQRVTSYARSHTIARISDDNLSLIAAAGLNRIHIGMESGSDRVLASIKKGVGKETQVKAGLKVKKAGMELSEYVMPGLGGVALSSDHALETADALNQINPDFIRLRTLAIPSHVELCREYEEGTFQKLSGLDTARELYTFIEHLDGITSTLKSDHILNLFEDLEGKFPEDKGKMVGIVSEFLNMVPDDQVIYQVGRRMGMFRGLSDMKKRGMATRVEEICERNNITSENVDTVIDEMMKRFI